MTGAATAAERARAELSLWTYGKRARSKCWPSQRPLYDAIRDTWGQGVYSALCHRNFGKSTVLIGVADEECRREPNTPCAIVTDTKDHAQKIVDEKMTEYLEGCPKALRPVPTDSKYVWRYPNGSTLWMYGADDHRHVKTLRGIALRFVGFDEAGHVEGTNGIGLQRILRAILFPALAKRLKARPDRPGHVVLATTSPLIPGHEFWAEWDACQAAGRAFFLPISKNPDFSDEYRAARALESGGFDSLDYRREYECAEVADPRTTVLPSVTDARLKGTDGGPALVQPVSAPGAREWYRSMDIGGKHLTGVLWGYYEPTDDSVRISREAVDANASAPELAVKIRDTEAALFGVRDPAAFLAAQQEAWTNLKAWPRVMAQIRHPEYFEGWADNNNLYLLHDLDTQYGIRFIPTRKDEKMAQIGALRKMLDAGRFIVDTRCVVLANTLKKAQWASAGKGFAETPEIGHADLLDAALYLVRNVRRRPYPLPEYTMEQQIGVPGARQRFRTRSMRELSGALDDGMGWAQ